jgi:putative transcriptional regulator
MVKHHPDSNMLAEYSANSLPAAQSVCVSTHLDHCTLCQQKLAQLESIGGVMLEDTAPVSVDPQVFEDVLLRLDEVPDDRAANDANASTLSWTVKQVRQGKFRQATVEESQPLIAYCRFGAH